MRMKYIPKYEVCSKEWDMFKFMRCVLKYEICTKIWDMFKIMRCAQKYEIWSMGYVQTYEYVICLKVWVKNVGVDYMANEICIKISCGYTVKVM